jgi:probable F420-dependent oxidoreductase
MDEHRRARFGYTVFNLTVDEQIELAALADELGFDAAWFGEHIVLPHGSQSVYSPPGTQDDPTRGAGVPKSIYDEHTRLYDLVALTAAVARETKRIAIVTGVYLATLRHPLMTARSIATLDELSRGRFQLGVGVGWNRGEIEALGGDFENRGSILDETVEILRMAMRGGPFAFHGRHFDFGPMLISQRPFSVPLLFGGHSAPALRRAARVGDGWTSSISNNPDGLVRLTRRIDALREEFGTADRPFRHWIKTNTADPADIDRLSGLGVQDFILYGERLWGPGEVSFRTRCERLRQVARAFGLDRG